MGHKPKAGRGLKSRAITLEALRQARTLAGDDGVFVGALLTILEETYETVKVVLGPLKPPAKDG
jgi:hypothetical protein